MTSCHAGMPIPFVEANQAVISLVVYTKRRQEKIDTYERTG